MKIKILAFVLVVTGMMLQSCSDYLEKAPLGTETDQNFYNDADNAVLAVNAIYDVSAWDEGSDAQGNYIPHNYMFMFGDIMSDDAMKGSSPSDFVALKELEEFRADAGNGVVLGVWNNMYIGIFRANTVIQNLPNATGIDDNLKDRLMGEARFLRGYFYFYLARVFGGVPLFEAPVAPSEIDNITRASLSEIYAFIEQDFMAAADLLPFKSQYGSTDLGRATKGAAQAYAARVAMFQVGFGLNGKTWNDVQAMTNMVINSGEYSLMSNYAEIYETEGENGVESIFEIQLKESSVEWGAQKVGSTNFVFQNNRTTWGWGFNNPTQDLVDAFEDRDPRLPCTAYADGDIVLGTPQAIDYPAENETGYLNRKAAGIQPLASKASGQNMRRFRYADVLLMHAEAAYHLGDEATARDMVNQIRARALNSSKPKGSAAEGDLSYPAYGAGELDGALPEVTASGTALLDAIYHERRVELAMEALRFWDLTRTGRYMSSVSAEIATNAQSHSITDGVTHPYPVCPIPISEVNDWGLAQNPAY